jgi:hypothetical protein
MSGHYLPYRVVGGTCSIGVCDRCQMKMYLGDLRPDGDQPGLKVCSDCSDQKDPYRLPPRRTEKLSVKYPRPDTPLE